MFGYKVLLVTDCLQKSASPKNVYVHIVLFCFFLPFVGLLAELSLDKICQYCICFNFFLFSGMFAAPLWVPTFNVLVCGGTGNNQSELLHVKNFRGLSAGTAHSPFDVIFSVR